MNENARSQARSEQRIQARELGPFECVSTNLSRQYGASIFWYTAILHTSQPLEENNVISACKILAKKQEVLRMCIVPEDLSCDYSDKFRFQPLENPEQIDFSSLSIKTEEDWTKIVTDNHELRKIDVGKGPLWQIIFMTIEEKTTQNFPYHYVIVLKFIHTIVDGVSAFDFVNHQFLPVLSKLQNSELAYDLIREIPLTRNLEDYFPESQNRFTLFTRVRLKLMRWKNYFWKADPYPDYKFLDDVIPNEDFVKDTVIVATKFEEKLSEAVILTAKKHNVTVHCILLAAGAMAFSRTAKAARIKFPSPLRQQWSVSLRKELGFKSPIPLGCFATNAETAHETITDLTEEEFWNTCRTVKAEVEYEKCIDNSINYLKGVKYVHEEALKSNLLTVFSELGQPAGLFFSNLGNMTGSSENLGKDAKEDIKISEQYFSLTGLAVTDFCPLSQLLLTFENRFMFSFCFNPKKVSRRFVNTYIENLKTVLSTFCMDDKNDLI